jgi:hypothetical protein
MKLGILWSDCELGNGEPYYLSFNFWVFDGGWHGRWEGFLMGVLGWMGDGKPGGQVMSMLLLMSFVLGMNGIQLLDRG